jgi:anti-sigma regulatory factor (Ser/Thr protein kinase)
MANQPFEQTGARRAETLQLKNDLVELERLGESVARFGSRCAWPIGVAQELELALDEVVTNIISYAYEDAGKHEICVRLVADAEIVTVEVEDDGRPFDPTTAPAAVTGGSIEERPIGGLGWHLVRSVTDGLAYRRAEGRNILTLTKRFAAS